MDTNDIDSILIKMNRINGLILKGLKGKVLSHIFSCPQLPELKYINNRIEANKIMADALRGDNSCMIARYGANELSAIVNYLGTLNKSHSIVKYLKGEIDEWWWSHGLMNQMARNAGFFPATEENLIRYCRLSLSDASEIDVLGSWLPNEYYVDSYSPNCTKVRLRYLEPDFSVTDASNEWTQVLQGKRVLVIHPFVETIKKQYAKRHLLFKAPNLLPDFQLLTIKAVQSLGGQCEYASWFDALKHMEDEMDKLDYDIAIIGCGAYGFNLAAHAKRTGHKAIHLGGASQLLFGIIGKRWENREYYKDIINEHWCRPDESERPATADSVEGGCYW